MSYLSDMRRFNIVMLFAAMICVTLAISRLAGVAKVGKYEASMYQDIGVVFWFGLVAAVVLGLAMIFVNAAHSSRSHKSWVFGLVPVFLSNSVLLLLPLIRGYAAYGRGDVLTHIGWINEITANGNTGQTDFYPFGHILCALTNLASSIDTTTLSMIQPAIFSVLYPLYFFVMSRVLLQSRSSVLLATAISSLLLFGNYHLSIAPYNQSFLFLPFVLYAILAGTRRIDRRPFAVLLFVLIFAIVFFHPLTTLVMMGILTVTFSCHNRSWSRTRDIHPAVSSYRYVIAGFAGFMIWQSYAYFLVGSMRKAFLQISGQVFSSEYVRYSDMLMNFNPDAIEFIRIILFTYGQMIMIGVISLWCIFAIVKRLRRKMRRMGFQELFGITGWALFVATASIAFLSVYVVGFNRLYVVAMIFGTILIGLASDNLRLDDNSARKKRWIRTSLAIVVVSLLTIVSVSNLFLSPRVLYPNQHITEAEITGMTYFLESREDDHLVFELGLSQSRFHDLILGPDSPKANIRYGSVTSPPNHFGYDFSDFLGSQFENTVYLVVNDLGRNYYEYLLNDYPGHEDRWLFTDSDFADLETDRTVNRVFSNGNIEVYAVSPL